MKTNKNKFPSGWDEERVNRVLAHYEQQSEEEAVAEDEEALRAEDRVFMEVPAELVPTVRDLISRHQTLEKK